MWMFWLGLGFIIGWIVFKQSGRAADVRDWITAKLGGK